MDLSPDPVDLAVVDLVAGTPADWSHLDQAKVDLFVGLLDELPPVVVFRTGLGLLLADGYHRVEAARRSGRPTVRAIVVDGSAGDALRHAAKVGAAETGVTEAEALRRILTRYAPGQGS